MLQHEELTVCQALLVRDEPKIWTERPPTKMEGIYMIMEYHPQQNWLEVIYVGRGQLRKRLNRHFKNTDGQPLGAYLAKFSTRQKNSLFTVDWQEVEHHRCKEKAWIRCIESALGYHPRLNIKEGDSCKT